MSLDILAQTLPFFAILLAGFLVAKAGWIAPAGIAGLNLYVFWLALPALLFDALASRDLASIFELSFVAPYALVMAILFFIGLLAHRSVFGLRLGDATIAAWGGMYANIGFMGLPLVVGLLGSEAALPIILILILDLTLLMGLVVVLMEIARDQGGSPRRALGQIGKGLATNPLILSIALGLGWAVTGWTVPSGLQVTVDLLAPTAGPPALFAIGAALASRPLQARSIGPISLTIMLKLIAHPLLTFAVLSSLAPDLPPIWIAAATLAAAMPAAGNMFVLAERYGTFATPISAAILLSTLLAAVTVPLVVGSATP